MTTPGRRRQLRTPGRSGGRSPGTWPTGDDYVLVNYARKSLGQTGGGHISPLGAYDEASDSFLIMDVNPNRAPWVWVGADDLIGAMRTFDTVENRGYLLISEKG